MRIEDRPRYSGRAKGSVHASRDRVSLAWKEGRNQQRNGGDVGRRGEVKSIEVDRESRVGGATSSSSASSPNSWLVSSKTLLIRLRQGANGASAGTARQASQIIEGNRRIRVYAAAPGSLRQRASERRGRSTGDHKKTKAISETTAVLAADIAQTPRATSPGEGNVATS